MFSTITIFMLRLSSFGYQLLYSKSLVDVGKWMIRRSIQEEIPRHRCAVFSNGVYNERWLDSTENLFLFSFNRRKPGSFVGWKQPVEIRIHRQNRGVKKSPGNHLRECSGDPGYTFLTSRTFFFFFFFFFRMRIQAASIPLNHQPNPGQK